MNTYTLEDLRTIDETKRYLTRDRFVHYFTTRFSYTERDANEAYNIFIKFPNCIYNHEDITVDAVIPKAIQIVKDMENGWDKNGQLKNLKYDEKELRKLIYKKGEDIHELELNLHDANDIITYSCLLQQEDFQQISLLRFCCYIQIKNTDKYMNIFEGDIFNTNDSFYGNKSNVYVAETRSTFKKLLYIKGKGYLNKGQLNIDEEHSYNSHCLSLKDWEKIGNTTQNIKILSDN